MRSGMGSAVRTAARALGPSWRSLRTKIIVWFFVPTAIILVTVALVNFSSYQDVTEDLVLERDQDLTHLSAVQLSTQLKSYTDLLADVARGSPFLQSDPVAQQAALRASSSRLLAWLRSIPLGPWWPPCRKIRTSSGRTGGPIAVPSAGWSGRQSQYSQTSWRRKSAGQLSSSLRCP